jgi:FixJ family two-component response regulator
MTNITTVEHTQFQTSLAPDTMPMVFVVDADISVRRSLALLIQASGWRAETFASAREFLARPRATVPNCLVLDVALPDVSGLDLQQRVAVDRSDMPVIFITGCGDVSQSVRAMKAGAIEFLIRPFREDVLVGAIRHGLERSRRTREYDAKTKALRENYESLTPREREVMVLVASGFLNKQVGGELGISEITVKAHRGQVMRKMKADSLPALVNMVAALGSLRTDWTICRVRPRHDWHAADRFPRSESTPRQSCAMPASQLCRPGIARLDGS